MLLSAQLHGLPDPEAATSRALREVEMTDASERQTGGYSKGMKQRVKIAAALVHDPQVLLLDEPFNGTDPRQRLQMMDMLRRMAADGRTVLFSSHILEEVERLGENVLVLVAGRAGRLRRLPRDSQVDDGPAAHVHHPLEVTTAAWPRRSSAMRASSASSSKTGG